MFPNLVLESPITIHTDHHTYTISSIDSNSTCFFNPSAFFRNVRFVILVPAAECRSPAAHGNWTSPLPKETWWTFRSKISTPWVHIQYSDVVSCELPYLSLNPKFPSKYVAQIHDNHWYLQSYGPMVTRRVDMVTWVSAVLWQLDGPAGAAQHGAGVAAVGHHQGGRRDAANHLERRTTWCQRAPKVFGSLRTGFPYVSMFVSTCFNEFWRNILGNAWPLDFYTWSTGMLRYVVEV